ncbi:hypothetical protein PLESTB_000434900 [Pleodorina starrii]|uniref:Uncharacterized protein n=1 Tax=Pleodorina starrii TaxID=330485 RepID=A0A9W6BFI5_9CHLO|nr:hypothetical protein PLESTB_000434900 [Pleodorina starrii]
MSGRPDLKDKDREKDRDKDRENRPAVMAECYKITQQPAGGPGGGGNEVAQSITMIKYTNLKQELARGDDAEEPDDVLVPTNMLLVPTVAVEVAIWSLGVFRLKGVTEPIKILQVLPTQLEGRLALLNKAGLNRGKARCIERRVACLDVITLQLPDVSRLSCVATAAAAAAAAGSVDAAGTGGGGGGGGYSPGGEESFLDEDGGGAAGGGGGGGGGGFGQALTDEFMEDAGADEDVDGGSGGGGAMESPDPSAPSPQLTALPAFAALTRASASGGGAASAAFPAPAPVSATAVAAGQGFVGPIVLGQGQGQAGSVADAGARWAALQLQTQMRSGAFRELESSEVGLPPISEVATPVSSPLLHSREGFPPGTGAAAGGPLSSAARTPPGARRQVGHLPLHLQPPPAADIEDGRVAEPSAYPSDTGDDADAGTGLLQQLPVRTSPRAGGIRGSRPGFRSSGAGTAPVGYGQPPYGVPPDLHSHHHHHHHHHHPLPYPMELRGGPLGGEGAAAAHPGIPAFNSFHGGGGGGGGLESVTSVSSAADGRPSGGASQGGDRQSAAQRGGEGTSAAPLSTGLLPSSLSYMAHRSGRERDTMSTYAAMVSAGMDVRSPGGSPVNTALGPPGRLLLPYQAAAAAAVGHDVELDPTAAAAVAAVAAGHWPSPPRLTAAAAAAAAYRYGYPPLVSSPLQLNDRGSAGTHTTTTTATHTRSALVIDRSSSGFHHAFSGSQTPGPALTERSSSGRYGSAHVPPALLGTDRSSSTMPPPYDPWSPSGGGDGRYALAALSPRGGPSSAGAAAATAAAASTSAAALFGLGSGGDGVQQQQQPQLLQLQEPQSPSGFPPYDVGAAAATGSGRYARGLQPPLPQQQQQQQLQYHDQFDESDALEVHCGDDGGGRSYGNGLGAVTAAAAECRCPGAAAAVVDLAGLYDDSTARVIAAAAAASGRGGDGGSAPDGASLPSAPQPPPGGGAAAAPIGPSAAAAAAALQAPATADPDSSPSPRAAASASASPGPESGDMSERGPSSEPAADTAAAAPRAAAAAAAAAKSSSANGVGVGGSGSAAAAAGLDSANLTHLYDITVSVRSSLAGSAAGGLAGAGGVGRVGSSAGLVPAGEEGGLRTFGVLGHMLSSSGLREPVSASDLLRSLAGGGGRGAGGGSRDAGAGSGGGEDGAAAAAAGGGGAASGSVAGSGSAA